jgi:hypothetical protein
MTDTQYRDQPHCPDCTDDLVLAFVEERVVKDERTVVLEVPEMRCLSCGFVGRRRSFARDVLETVAEQFFLYMEPGQVVKPPLRGQGHRFKRFEHLQLSYDARDYFYYPRLGGEDQDGFLCPVFFDKDALVFFNNHPKYRLVMRSSSSGSIMAGDEPLLSHGFGVNRNGRIFMWLGDIDRALSGPATRRELDILKAFNVDSDHDLASTYFFSQLPGNDDEAFFESNNEAKVFQLIDEINAAFANRFGAPLFKVDIQRLAEAYRLPVLEDRQQIFQAFMSLNINLVENMDHARLRSLLLGHGLKKEELLTKDGNELRSNKLLQMLLERVLCMSPQDAYSTMTPLFVVNDLRQLHGHLTEDSFEEKYTKYKKALGLTPESRDLEVHARLVELLIASLEKIKEALSEEPARDMPDNTQNTIQ